MLPFAVIENDKEMHQTICTLHATHVDAESYRDDLMAAYEWTEGIEITVCSVEEPLDRGGLKALVKAKEAEND